MPPALHERQAGWEASLAGPNSPNKDLLHGELRHGVVPEEEHLPAIFGLLTSDGYQDGVMSANWQRERYVFY